VINDNEKTTRIRLFLTMLHDNPTLADYQTMMGYSDYAEMQFYLNICRKDTKTTLNENAPLVNSKCRETLVNNWQDKTKTASLYLNWLSQQLSNTSFTISSSRNVQHNDHIIGQQVEINIDSKKVLFFLSTTIDTKKYGNINVLSINNVPINLLREYEAPSSILVSMGMVSLVRPFNELEIAEFQRQHRDECKADPVCTKALEDEQKQKEITELNTKIRNTVNSKYDTWCKQNINQCDALDKDTRKRNKEFNALETFCSKNKKQCKSKVYAYTAERRARKNPFCDNYPAECKKLDMIRSKHRTRKRAECKDKPKKCINMSPFEQALMSIKDSDS